MDQGRLLDQADLPVRAEAVDDRVGEGRAEGVAVAEPGITVGASSAPGSASPTQARIASASGESIGELLPTTASLNSIS